MQNAANIAKILLDIKAVLLNTEKPFQYTSGIISPIYCDNRMVISYPEAREQVLNAFLEKIKHEKLQFDVVAGTATAGIPHAAWIADRLKKPMIYVRGKSKGHGRQNQIEGHLEKGMKALVVEDLISTGKSSVAAGLALRDAGAVVNDCIAIFTYQLPEAIQAFHDSKLNCFCLSGFKNLLKVALDSGYINEEQKALLLKWNQDQKNYR